MDSPQSFVYSIAPSRVVFGQGKVQTLPGEMQRLGVKHPIILTTPRQMEQGKMVKALLGNVGDLFTEATMHTPTNITDKALEQTKDCRADCVISIGGGSTIGLGKAISVRTGLPHICIPTTYAGSEMTPILGETANGIKQTRSDTKILPGTVIYDVNLTLSLPASMSATSGVNAIAHAVEALYAENRNPVISLLALEGIKALAVSLPAVVSSPSDIAARSSAQYGAWLCGLCLGSVGMALHHKLCHTLGGSFNLPHAETHTIVLPHAVAYNAPAVPEAMEKLAEVLPGSSGDAVHGLNLLLNRLGVQRALGCYGFGEDMVDKAAEIAVGNPYYNPRPIEKSSIKELIRRAQAGEAARSDL